MSVFSRRIMTAEILDGKMCGSKIEQSLTSRISYLKSQDIQPHLVVIMVGDDPASAVYVAAKQRACERLELQSTLVTLPSTCEPEEVIKLVMESANNPKVNGILVQSPLPEGHDELKITNLIPPEKDVDGFNSANLGKIIQGNTSGLLPCTPAGVMELLSWGNINLQGMKAVVIGRSRIVGMPLALLLSQRGVDATVTLAHSRSNNIESIVKESDLVIAAVGVPNMVKSEWIKPGAIIIDVGVNRVNDESKEKGYFLCGDVSSDAINVAGKVSPVPGGVGPMTIAMLMSNTVLATEIQHQINGEINGR